MRSLSSQHSMLWSSRSLVALLLSLAVPLAIAACGNESSPLAPSDSDPSSDAGAPASQAAPDLSLIGSGQRILFTSNRPGSSYYDLYKVDPLGGNLAHVTSLTGYETEPAWSFDNKQIAMVRPRPSRPDDRRRSMPYAEAIWDGL